MTATKTGRAASPDISLKDSAPKAMDKKHSNGAKNIRPLPSTDVMTEVEAAAFLKQNPRTLRLWRQKRAIPFFRITTKTVLYHRADLIGWLERNRMAVIQMI